MRARFRSWWQKANKSLLAVKAIALLIVVFVIVHRILAEVELDRLPDKNPLGLASTSFCSHYTCHWWILAVNFDIPPTEH
jgi:hypothetical protein